MRNKKLQGQVTAGRWTLPIVVFICTLCWVLTSFLLPDLTASTVEDSTLSLWQSARDLLLPAWAERLVSYLIYAVIGYSLIELNNRFGIIRMRASMQTAIYFLLVTICPEMHLLYAGDIAALAFLFSIYFLFKVISSRRQQAIYSIPSFSSEREACFSPNSPSFRYSGYSKLTVFRHSSPVVSAVRS